MLIVTERCKQEYLTDGVHKELVIDFIKNDLSKINWSSMTPYLIQQTSVSNKNLSEVVVSGLNSRYPLQFIQNGTVDRVTFKLNIAFTSWSCSQTPDSFNVGVRYTNSNNKVITETNSYDISQWIGSNLQSFHEVEITLDCSTGLDMSKDLYLFAANFTSSVSATYSATILIADWQVVLYNNNQECPEIDNQIHYTIAQKFLDNIIYTKNNKQVIIHNDNIEKESLNFVESLCSQENVKYGLVESSNIRFTLVEPGLTMKNKRFKVGIKTPDSDMINLGTFTVDSAEKTADYEILKYQVTGYDDLNKLDGDASTWADNYMYGVNTSTYSGKGFEYTRQMFSTLFNLLQYAGMTVPAKNIKKSMFTARTDESLTIPLYDNNDILIGTSTLFRMTFVPEENKLYKFEYTDLATAIPSKYRENQSFRFNAKGFFYNGTVLVEETLSTGKINKFFCNMGDWFVLHEGTTSVKVHFPHIYTISGTSYTNNTRMRLTCCDNPYDNLPNAATRLMYYDYTNRKVATISGSMKDIIRSLTEINGVFFRLNKDTNEPTFKGVSRKGLYPSEKLYPSEALYPRFGNSETVTRSKYKTSIAQDYSVQDFGAIVISGGSTYENGRSDKLYVVDSKLSNIYELDDNAFYSNSTVVYDKDTANIPEVEDMLSKLYSVIKETGYTPHDTSAVGMPWLEIGDRFALLNSAGGYETFIFRRTLSGIQILSDNYEADGEELTAAGVDYNIGGSNIVTYICDGMTYEEYFNNGSSILQPTTFTPTKPECTFLGWSVNRGDPTTINEYFMDGLDVTLYAVFKYNDVSPALVITHMPHPDWDFYPSECNRTWSNAIDMAKFKSLSVYVNGSSRVNHRGGYWDIYLSAGGSSITLMHPYVNWDDPAISFPAKYAGTVTLNLNSTSGLTYLTTSGSGSGTNGWADIDMSSLKLYGRTVVG